MKDLTKLIELQAAANTGDKEAIVDLATYVFKADFAALDEKIKRYEEAFHYLIERAEDSNDAKYGTLSTDFVRDVCSKALEQ